MPKRTKSYYGLTVDEATAKIPDIEKIISILPKCNEVLGPDYFEVVTELKRESSPPSHPQDDELLDKILVDYFKVVTDSEELGQFVAGRLTAKQAILAELHKREEHSYERGFVTACKGAFRSQQQARVDELESLLSRETLLGKQASDCIRSRLVQLQRERGL